jgi:hypothetical protein
MRSIALALGLCFAACLTQAPLDAAPQMPNFNNTPTPRRVKTQVVKPQNVKAKKNKIKGRKPQKRKNQSHSRVN